MSLSFLKVAGASSPEHLHGAGVWLVPPQRSPSHSFPQLICDAFEPGKHSEEPGRRAGCPVSPTFNAFSLFSFCSPSLSPNILKDKAQSQRPLCWIRLSGSSPTPQTRLRVRMELLMLHCQVTKLEPSCLCDFPSNQDEKDGSQISQICQCQLTW